MLAFELPPDRRRLDRIACRIPVAVASRGELRAPAKNVTRRGIESTVAGGLRDVAANHLTGRADRQSRSRRSFGPCSLRRRRIIVSAEKRAQIASRTLR